MKQLKLTLLLLLSPLFNLFYAQITVHSEDFATGIGTWSAISVTDANNVWTATSGYMEMNGFGGTDDEDWLISPAINMNGQTDEYIMFDYNDYYDGPWIEMYYSTNYNGGGTVADLNAATWTNLPLRVFDINRTSCFTTKFMRHPALDISNINGAAVYFAFKYVGQASNSKDYKIDNVRILAEYYGSVNTFIQGGGNCDLLKTEIYKTLTHQYDELAYTSSTAFDLWDGLLAADRRLNDAGTDTIVWDMFTDIPTGTGEFEFNHCTNRDNGTCPGAEGSCYNREHSFPRSWWGGTTTVSDTINYDMHHITPADKAMNILKLNYPPGIVQTASGTGSNGFKAGTNSSYPCSSMNYFEPIDAYKGDYARMYLYIATRYEPVITGWVSNTAESSCALSGNSYTVYNPWLLNLLLTWHAQDPVSQKEIDRNNAIYSMQGNRNPYIDHPEWVGYVWGDYMGNPCTSLAPGPCTPNTGSETQVACNSYLWLTNGQTYTTSGNYTATLTNVSGCDSVVTLHLTINNSNTGNQTTTSCNSYTWLANNQTYTTGGTYTATLTNMHGCDSIATLNLTITNSTSGSESATACDTYTWSTNSQTYTTSGAYTALLTNTVGCDSTATLNLTINNSNSGNQTTTACNSYTWPANNQNYTTGGTYTATLTNMAGCDSIATLNLTIDVNSIDTSVVQNGITLTSNDNTGAYQWIDCNTGSALNGETTVSFTATSNGSYAVQITQGSCVDTSMCHTISTVGIEEMNLNDFAIFPNPASSKINIESSNHSVFSLQLVDLSGATVLTKQISNSKGILDVSNLANGVYFIKIKTAESEVQTRIVISK